MERFKQFITFVITAFFAFKFKGGIYMNAVLLEKETVCWQYRDGHYEFYDSSHNIVATCDIDEKETTIEELREEGYLCQK